MDKHLHDTLEQLHRDIEETKFVDAEDERLLRDLLDDIGRLIEASERRREQNESLRDRLGHAMERFEESHPTLAANIGRLSEALGRLAV